MSIHLPIYPCPYELSNSYCLKYYLIQPCACSFIDAKILKNNGNQIARLINKNLAFCGIYIKWRRAELRAIIGSLFFHLSGCNSSVIWYAHFTHRDLDSESYTLKPRGGYGASRGLAVKIGMVKRNWSLWITSQLRPAMVTKSRFSVWWFSLCNLWLSIAYLRMRGQSQSCCTVPCYIGSFIDIHLFAGIFWTLIICLPVFFELSLHQMRIVGRLSNNCLMAKNQSSGSLLLVVFCLSIHSESFQCRTTITVPESGEDLAVPGNILRYSPHLIYWLL